MDSKKIRFSPTQFLPLFLLVGLLVLLAPEIYSANKPFSVAEYVLKIYKRAISVGNEVLKLEEDLIFRLERKRAVDLDRTAARFVSGRRQVVFLRILGEILERRIPTGNPLTSQIQTVKARFPLLLDVHKKNMNKIAQLTKGELLKAIRDFENTSKSSPPASFTEFFKMGTIEDRF